MKNFKFLGFVLIFMVLGLASCKPESDNPVNKTTKVYGTVFDSSTGDPMARALVALVTYVSLDEEWGDIIGGKIVSTTYSGSDGQYEFILDEVSKDLNYMLIVGDMDDSEAELPISIKEGQSYKFDLPI